MKIRVVGYWSYNTGETAEETIRIADDERIITEEGGVYLSETGLPDTINYTGYKIPKEELQRIRREWKPHDRS